MRLLAHTAISFALLGLVAACVPVKGPPAGLTTEAPSTIGSKIVNRSSAVYRRPSVSAPHVGRLRAGTRVRVYGRRGAWTLVDLGHGRGWIRTAYLGHRRPARTTRLIRVEAPKDTGSSAPAATVASTTTDGTPAAVTSSVGATGATTKPRNPTGATADLPAMEKTGSCATPDCTGRSASLGTDE